MFQTTPIEQYEVKGRRIYVKREDLCSDDPGMPPLSKMRGVYRVIEKRSEKLIGAIDTKISKSGQGISCICHRLGKVCEYYFPFCKEDHLQDNHLIARDLNKAILHPLPGGRIGIAYNRALADIYSKNGYMMPLGLPVYETVEETADVIRSIPADLLTGTIVLATGTGTILAGVIAGLSALGIHNRVVGVSASMSIKKQTARAQNHLSRYFDDYRIKDLTPRVDLHQPAGSYYDPGGRYSRPFPSHPYYEGKAWDWLIENLADLADPVLFYNVGS